MRTSLQTLFTHCMGVMIYMRCQTHSLMSQYGTVTQKVLQLKQQTDKYNNTPLHLAASHIHTSIVELLLLKRRINTAIL